MSDVAHIAANAAIAVTSAAAQVSPFRRPTPSFHADVDTVSRFKTLVHLLREAWPHYTGRDARLFRKNNADCQQAKLCHFCASTSHFRTTCLCFRSYRKKCYRCDLELWVSIRVHDSEGGFGTAICHFVFVQKIFIKMWTMRW